jgi:hypothetical protein
VKPTGFLDDLHAFDPATMTWTNLSAADDAGRPSARSYHGFTSARGLLYVHGGYGITSSRGVGEDDERVLDSWAEEQI